MMIDIHTHFYPRPYLDELARRTEVPRLDRQADGERLVLFADEERLAGPPRAIAAPFFVLEEKLRFMDRHGIERSVISIGNPWVDFMSPGEARSWATRLNELVEKSCLEEERFLGFGVVPLQEVDAACEEVLRIARLSRLRGLVIGTRPGQRHLDDPVLEPFWLAVEEQELAVLVHPHYTVGPEWMGGYGHAPLLALGFTFETTVAVTRLILGGVLRRHPRLTLILAHCGGALPYLAGRLDACTAVDGAASRNLDRPFSAYLKMLYLDAVTYHPAPLRCALDLVGSERLMFGTDHPFGIADPGACTEAVERAVSTPAEREAILGGNARRLLDGAARHQSG